VSDKEQNKDIDAITGVINQLGKHLQEKQKTSDMKLIDRAKNIASEQLQVSYKPDQQEEFVERYIGLDSWLLYSEAIPIAIGFRPEYIDLAKKNEQYLSIEKLAKSSANISLNILNKDDSEEKWRVLPKEFIGWAIKKELEVLTMLHQKLELKPKKELNIAVSNAQGERHSAKREQILMAAVFILGNFSSQCIGRGGKVSATEIARVMEEKSPLWFGDNDIPLSPRRVKEILSSALNLPE
jgi:hypothetical protein